jgi:hypothetical protein
MRHLLKPFTLVAGLAIMVPQPGTAVTIGPDAFGYTATNDVASPFENISGTGTRVLADVDDATVSVPIGFAFRFYGVTYPSLFVSSNGLITFASANASGNNQSLATDAVVLPQPAIASFWDDLTVDRPGTDGVYVATLGSPGSRRLVLQWNDVSGGGGTSPSFATFQAVLLEDSHDILFRYLDVVTGDGHANGGSATIGIRDAGGQSNGRFLEWSFGGGPGVGASRPVTDGETILFHASPVPQPPAWLLVLAPLAGGLARRRRRTARSRCRQPCETPLGCRAGLRWIVEERGTE